MRRRYLKWLVLFYAVWIVSFQLVGNVACRLTTYDLRSSWDNAIPLWPTAVWAYEACYLLPFLPVLVARDFRRIRLWLVACTLASVTAFALYLALPVAFPRAALGDSWAERVLQLEYDYDFRPGANNLPSLHVALSWLSWLACLKQGQPRWLTALVLLLVLAITASTLLVKQHLLIDAALGVAWAFSSWAAARVATERWDSRAKSTAARPAASP